MSARAFYGGQSGQDMLVTGEMAPARELVTSGVAGGTTGTFSLLYFTARKTETINTVTVWTGSTGAAATPTLIRFGIYSIAADGGGTLVAATVNDTTLLAAANTEYSKALAAPFSKVAGRRYAIGTLVVSATTMPNFQGQNASGTTASTAFLSLPPRQSGRLTGQADLPSTFTDASLITSPWKIATRLS